MALRFKASVQLIEFDKKAFVRAIDEHMRETTEEAARSWLSTVLVRIPTWSRASRATFETLANEVGFNIQYGPIRSPKDRLLLGLSTGRGGTKFKKGRWTFFYETDLRYLALNDLKRAVQGDPGVFSRAGIPSTPFKFVQAGQEDFKSFAAQVELPPVSDFIKPRRIS